MVFNKDWDSRFFGSGMWFFNGWMDGFSEDQWFLRGFMVFLRIRGVGFFTGLDQLGV